MSARSDLNGARIDFDSFRFELSNIIEVVAVDGADVVVALGNCMLSR